MTAPTDVPVFPAGPLARQARAEHLHRRMQIEHAYLTRARQEFHSGHPATRAMRAAHICAKYQAALDAHDAQTTTIGAAA